MLLHRLLLLLSMFFVFSWLVSTLLLSLLLSSLFWFILFFCLHTSLIVFLYLITDTHTETYTGIFSKLFCTANMPILLYPTHQTCDILISTDTINISYQNQHPSSPGHSHIHPPPILKKSNLSCTITSNQGDNNALLLPTLNAINSGNVGRRHVSFSYL
jgi:hypothetical protein